MTAKIVHLDLFSGIGGFAWAVDQVWEGATHIFCDNDKYCQEVLKLRWPRSKIYGDIRHIANKDCNITIATGGFPCQPFSQAGRRRGTADYRYLWPEMLRVIRLTEPTWVIAENVRGLLTMQQGVVFEQVCTDLEESGYEVQPFIIPAVAVNAPHRRDRVWFVACRADTINQGLEGRSKEVEGHIGQSSRDGGDKGWDWNKNWIEVATCFCGMDDGLPASVDGFELSKASHRVQRLKALGNAIVPQVAVNILQAIKCENELS